MTAGHQSYADVYRNNMAYANFPREFRQSGGIPVEFIRVKQAQVDATDPATHCFALGLALAGETGFTSDFGEGIKQLRGSINDMYLNPTLHDLHYTQSQPQDLLFVSAPLNEIAARLDIEIATLNHALRPLHDTMVKDTFVRQQLLYIWEHAAKEGEFAALAVDQGLLAMVTALMYRARPKEYPRSTKSLDFDAQSLARVLDYIEASLEDNFNLEALADIAGLPANRFAQAFKRHKNQTPYQYVLERRIEKAKQLLAFHSMALIDIAYVCGFSSQQHMTSVFAKRLGITPAHYRREVKQ